MTVQDFVNTYTGKAVDFDGAFGAQCVDLIQFYNRDVVGGARLTGNAKDIFGQDSANYAWIKNTVSGIPPVGSLVVYGSEVGGGYGDVCISLGGNTSTFTGFGQNYPYGSVSHSVARNYTGMIGWGVPKNNVNASVSGGTAEAIREVNVRVAPNTGSASGGSQKLTAGQTFTYSSKVTGENVSQNGVTTNVWYHSTKGNYVWAGNCRDV